VTELELELMRLAGLLKSSAGAKFSSHMLAGEYTDSSRVDMSSFNPTGVKVLFEFGPLVPIDEA